MSSVSQSEEGRGDVSAPKPDASVTSAFLTAKSEEWKDLLGLAFKTFTLYVAITGALLKFALDDASTPTLQVVLISFGALVSAFCLYICQRGRMVHTRLESEQKQLHTSLGLPIMSSSLYSLSQLIVLARAFVLITFVCWLALLHYSISTSESDGSASGGEVTAPTLASPSN